MTIWTAAAKTVLAAPLALIDGWSHDDGTRPPTDVVTDRRLCAGVVDRAGRDRNSAGPRARGRGLPRASSRPATCRPALGLGQHQDGTRSRYSRATGHAGLRPRPAGALGLAVTAAIMRSAPAMVPRRVPGLDQVGVDGNVLAFATALSIGAGPGPLTMRARRRPVGSGAGARTSDRRCWPPDKVALALVLLTAAGLLLRSFVAPRHLRPGGSSRTNVVIARAADPAPHQHVSALWRPLGSRSDRGDERRTSDARRRRHPRRRKHPLRRHVGGSVTFAARHRSAGRCRPRRLLAPGAAGDTDRPDERPPRGVALSPGSPPRWDRRPITPLPLTELFPRTIRPQRRVRRDHYRQPTRGANGSSPPFAGAIGAGKATPGSGCRALASKRSDI